MQENTSRTKQYTIKRIFVILWGVNIRHTNHSHTFTSGWGCFHAPGESGWGNGGRATSTGRESSALRSAGRRARETLSGHSPAYGSLCTINSQAGMQEILGKDSAAKRQVRRDPEQVRGIRSYQESFFFGRRKFVWKNTKKIIIIFFNTQ